LRLPSAITGQSASSGLQPLSNHQAFDEGQTFDEQELFNALQSLLQWPFIAQASTQQHSADQSFAGQSSAEQPSLAGAPFHFGKGYASTFDPTMSFDTSTHGELYVQPNSSTQHLSQSREMPKMRLSPHLSVAAAHIWEQTWKQQKLLSST